MPDKLWSDDVEVTAIHGFLKFKKFIHNVTSATAEDYWQKITAMVQAKTPADFKVKTRGQVYKKYVISKTKVIMITDTFLKPF